MRLSVCECGYIVARPPVAAEWAYELGGNWEVIVSEPLSPEFDAALDQRIAEVRSGTVEPVSRGRCPAAEGAVALGSTRLPHARGPHERGPQRARNRQASRVTARNRWDA